MSLHGDMSIIIGRHLKNQPLKIVLSSTILLNTCCPQKQVKAIPTSRDGFHLRKGIRRVAISGKKDYRMELWPYGSTV